MRGRVLAIALLAALCALLVPSSHAVPPPAAFIRVDQAGYEAGTAQRAYLMSAADERGAAFTVNDGTHHAVASGRVALRTGTWSTSAKSSFGVYAIDFTAPAGSGYTIAVAGRAPATSPAFDVGTASALYEPLLGNTLFYYRSVRDGPDFVPGPLSPAPAHLNDQHATTYYNPPIQTDGNELFLTTGPPLVPYGTTIDASGGHWDAGDNIKYVETESYATALMQIGVRDFPAEMGGAAPTVASRAGAVTPDFGNEAAFGMDFLSRMWDDKRRLLYLQVGNTQDWKNFPNLRADYDFWRLPQKDDSAPDHPPDDPDGVYELIRHRPVFVAAQPGSLVDPAGKPISPNLAGRLAADFALDYQLHHTATSLATAEHVFAQADTTFPDPATGERKLLTIVPYDGYPETVWHDDMELGATELYLATRTTDPKAASGYLAAALRFANGYNALPAEDKDTLNLYDVGSLANFELYRALELAGTPGPRAQLLAAITSQLDAARSASAGDAFGFGRDWRSGDTTTHGDGLAVMADEADFLLGSKEYDSDARRYLGNMLGANPWGVSLIIGDGSTWTNCPQQQPANLLGSLTGGSPELWGAAVEGPTDAPAEGGYATMRACPPGGGDVYAAFNGNNGAFDQSAVAVFRDNVQSYTTTEPAIDLTATSFLMFSWRQAGRPASLQ